MDRPHRDASPQELAVHLARGTAVDLIQLIRHFGRRVDWLGQPTAALDGAGLTPFRRQRLSELARSDELQRERDAARKLGARLVGWSQGAYPRRLRELYLPPVVLCVAGRWPPPARALAMVGSRAATAYGRQSAGQLAAAATAAGVAVVSGLARGVDRAALEAAAEGGGWPIAVLGCGLDVAYPREHRRLQATIAETGTVISEFPFGTRPLAAHFPRRNRIIAALAHAVLVVEASVRSGSLITAGHALELGREVWAVPGPIDSPTSTGANRLIFDGATPVLGSSELAELLGAELQPGTPAPGEPLLAALGRSALDADELAARAGADVRTVRARLLALELEGQVRRDPDGRYRARP